MLAGLPDGEHHTGSPPGGDARAKSGEIPALSRNCDALRGRARSPACVAWEALEGGAGRGALRSILATREVDRLRRLLSFVTVALLAAGCGDGAVVVSTPSTTTTITGFPVRVQTDEGRVVIETRPERIVSMSSTATEMLYAIGAGPRIVATDLYSDYPPAANDTPKLDAFNFSAEAVAATEPDLVLLAFDTQGEVESLQALGITAVVFGPADRLEDVYAQLTEVGRAVGLEAEAAGLGGALEERITTALAAGARVGMGRTVYHEVDPTLYSANSSTFIGDVYARLGMDNIADQVADELGGGYPQLSAELILASDPDVIFTTDGLGLDDLAARPGWSTLTAVQEGRVFILDPDIASRWGPRTAGLVESVVAAMGQATG